MGEDGLGVETRDSIDWRSEMKDLRWLRFQEAKLPRTVLTAVEAIALLVATAGSFCRAFGK